MGQEDGSTEDETNGRIFCQDVEDTEKGCQRKRRCSRGDQSAVSKGSSNPETCGTSVKEAAKGSEKDLGHDGACKQEAPSGPPKHTRCIQNNHKEDAKAEP